MTDLQTLVRQTSNPSILKMQQRLHEEVLVLGKQALEWKATCEALQLALETERDAANLYAKQVAHWIEKHDALLAQQLESYNAVGKPTPKASELKAQLCKRRIEMTEWVNFEKSGGPESAGAYLVASAYTKDVGQARWLPRKKEWKWPSAAMAFEMTHWAHMPSAPSDIA